VLHFAYNGANVRDGFDGLNGPGFSVFDDGINVVLALDLSQSMVGECANLQQLTRRFISAMLPGDKINIFGFNEGIPPYWFCIQITQTRLILQLLSIYLCQKQHPSDCSFTISEVKRLKIS